jgi:Icc-related predicted phosphoesterase
VSPLWKRRGARLQGLRIFFATDIHGSDRCFRKFLNAAAFYGATELIIGGDITGKALVPIERTPTGWAATFDGKLMVDLTDREKAGLEDLIRGNGAYPISGEREELVALRDEAHREEVFEQVVVREVTRWMEMADAKLTGTGISCYITPGNDDFFVIDRLLQESEVVRYVEGASVTIADGEYRMITTGYANPTPWETPRELPEDQLYERIGEMLGDDRDGQNLIGVLHPPPRDTTLDQAPAIDGEFRLQTEAGSIKSMSVGSSAVRRFIEEVQPLLTLHGHVHESRSEESIGRTLCINPGSEYSEGILTGALVTLRDGEVVAHQLVSG